MRYKSSVLEYKAFPDGADSVIIGGPCGDVCMPGLASSLGKTHSQTRSAIVFAAAVDFRSLLQLDAPPPVSAVEQQP